MVTIPLGTGDWELPTENVSRLKLRNMYVIENAASPDGMSRVSRPTLTPFATVGSGPIYGVWRQDSTFGGDWLVVSGQQLIRFNPESLISTVIGDVAGTDFPQFAGTADRVIVVRNKTAYSTDGVNLDVVVMPDDVPPYSGRAAPIKSVAVINSFFILTVEGTQRFYWIAPGETDPDPLSFASAERLPDSITAVAILQDEIWFIGPDGPEVWSPTDDLEAPFARINGRVYNEGTLYRDTVVNSTFNDLPCLLWVTTNGTVVLAQGSVKKISNNSVEEEIKNANNLRSWSFRTNKHDFYVLTADEFTYVFDLDRNEWGRWDSYLKENWVAHVGLQDKGVGYAGTFAGNSLYRLDEDVSDGDDPVIREVSGFVHNPGKPVQCASIAVRVNAGWSPSYELYPKLEVRWSDDQGATFSNYDEISLGNTGRYYEDTIFRSLGLIQRPGRIFEFRFAEKARFRLDYAVMNEV